MRTHVLHREQRLDGTPEEVFPFFADARNLEAITPPLLRFRVVTPGPIDLHAGTFIQYRLRLHGVPVTWHTIIQEWDPPPPPLPSSRAAAAPPPPPPPHPTHSAPPP